MSDGAEKLLDQMVGGFSLERAVDWLRVKFPSFDTSRAEPLDCAATKNERDYFADARLLGFVGRMPEVGTTGTNGTSGTARTSGTKAAVADVPVVPDVSEPPAASSAASSAAAASLAAALDDLFDRNKAAEEGAPTLFSKDETAALLDALYNCKVLDPACGSGAFPMGVLHCMVRLLTRLDPQNLAIRERLLKRYREDRERLAGEESPAELEARLREGQHFPDYERKLFLIENCIYGVDIQPIATQISKLRFFISLLCDQLRTSYDPSAENFGLLSLPNLEAKFVCANTLISLPEIGALDASAGDIATLRRDLQENRHKIFSARSTNTKEKYKACDLEIRDAIRKEVRDSLCKPDEVAIREWRKKIADAERRRKAVAEPDWFEEYENVQADLFSAFERKKVRKDRNEKERNAIDAEIRFAKDRIAKEEAKGDISNVGEATRYADMVAGWDPYDQNKSEGWFDPEWMFNITGGFDVVIGNPPYVKLETIKEASRLYEAEGYETFTRRGDLYVLFTERGFQFLADKGHLCYIMSNKWLQAEYGRPLREYFLERRLKRIVDFGDIQIFTGATTYPCIFLATGEAPTDSLNTVCLSAYHPESFAEDVEAWSRPCPVSRLSDDAWVLNLVEKELLDRLRKDCVTLDEKIGGGAYYGIKTGATDAFIIDEETRQKIISEDPRSTKIIHPVLRGRDIAPWYSDASDVYLIGTFPALNIDINDYPGVKRHLLEYGKKRLEQSGEPGSRKKTSNKWFETQDQIAYWRLFKRPKIMYQKFQTRPCFIYDEKGLFCNDSMWIIPTKEKWLVGLLNSKMGWWLISKHCTQIQNGYQLIWEYLGKIPVPGTTGTTGTAGTNEAAGRRRVAEVPEVADVPSSSAAAAAASPAAEIAALVDRILAAKKADPAADTKGLEAEIDAFVYKLYGLTEEEIKVVEGKDKAAQEAAVTAAAPAPSRKRSRAAKQAEADEEEDEVLE